MHPEQWPRVESTFHNALRIPLTERDSFVRSECGDDQCLYAEVVSLLHSHEAESLLDGGAASIAAGWLLATTHELQTGKRIGPYEICGEIGRGGMGVVYRAKDTRLDRDVALKFFCEAAIGRSERFPHFDREVRAASALNHPNIITIHDVGSADGVPYIACEFVDGVTLRERLARGQMDLEEVLHVGLQVAEALAVAHAVGIVHRDIKPENIMIRRDGLVKVVDFGVATLTTAGPAAGGACVSGTPRYMSPEQLRGASAGARIDVYSLGLVLYEMTAAQKPSSAVALSDVPPQLREVVNRSIATDPSQRYPSGAEMKAALEKLARTQRYSAPRKRRRLALTALTALVAAGIGLTLWIATFEESKDTPVAAVPFTGNPGYEQFPSFSPDGTRVAFSWEEPGKHGPNIYIKPIGLGEPAQLTTDPAGDFGPAWSPDGHYIAFLRARYPSRAVIVLIPAIGGRERELAGIAFDVRGLVQRHFWIDDVPPPFLAWSPDCRWLLSLESAKGNSNAIVGVRVETGEKRILISAALNYCRHGGLSISPDGKTLAFTRTLGLSASDIYVASLSTDKNMVARGGPRRLTFDGKEIDGLSWTANGQNLVFSSTRGRRRELWQMRASPKSKPVLLTAAASDPRHVAIAGKGRHLVHSHLYLDWNIWRVSLKDKTAEARKFISSTRIQEEPKYSPDGERIAFESSRSGNEEIWICNADGSRPVQLTAFGSAWAGSPRWSPDGQKIAFDCDAAGNIDIYVVSSNGGKPVRLTSNGANEFRPSWSHDGKWIYFCSDRTGRGEIWKIPSNGGVEAQVTRKGGIVASESVDGDDLYYTKEHTLWKMPLRGGNEIRISDSLSHNQFAPTKHGVYFIEDSQSSINANLKFLDFRTRLLRTIATVAGPFGDELTVSPDGRWMLYVKTDREGSELMLVENFR